MPIMPPPMLRRPPEIAPRILLVVLSCGTDCTFMDENGLMIGAELVRPHAAPPMPRDGPSVVPSDGERASVNGSGIAH
jgi:hypothetical protein